MSGKLAGFGVAALVASGVLVPVKPEAEAPQDDTSTADSAVMEAAEAKRLRKQARRRALARARGKPG